MRKSNSGKVLVGALIIFTIICGALVAGLTVTSSGGRRAIGVAPASAQSTTAGNTIIVNNITDPVSVSGNGFCTLREAINNANAESDTTGGDCVAGTGTDTIVFSVSGTITLSSSPPPIANILTIDGSGQTITIDGDFNYQVLYVSSGATLNLAALTITHGAASPLCEGGGGVYVDYGGTLNVTNSTFFENGAINGGGGIYNDGTLNVTNSTFSENSAYYLGGGGGIYNDGTLTVTNSILASSLSGGNCAGTIASGGYNISDDGSCGFGNSTAADGQTIGDNVDPLLDPNGLQLNGGPTQTIALESGSPAIDAIPIANCPPTDQCGDPRPAPGYSACDVGAFEYGSAVDFGTVAVGQSSATHLATLANPSAKNIRITGKSIGNNYQIISTTCPSVLNAHHSCTYVLRFRPRSAGTKNQVFQVSGSGSRRGKVNVHGVATRH